MLNYTKVIEAFTKALILRSKNNVLSPYTWSEEELLLFIPQSDEMLELVRNVPYFRITAEAVPAVTWILLLMHLS